MTNHSNHLLLDPHEQDILSRLSDEGYFNAISTAKLSKAKFLQSLLQVQEDERKKLGHELHDSVNASLSIARLYLSLLPATDEKSAFAKEQISYIINMTEQAIRSISCNLVVSQQNEAGVIHLIDTLAERVRHLKIFDILITYSHRQQLNKLPACQKIVLYRLVQEQLNNIIKHSRATIVNISLDLKEGQIKLTITDNGVGFDVKKNTPGIGLANMADRAKYFAGETKIISERGKGCAIIVSMPVLKVVD